MDGFDDFMDGSTVENSNQEIGGDLDMFGQPAEGDAFDLNDTLAGSGASGTPAPVTFATEAEPVLPAAASAPAVPEGPQIVDARIAWRAQNAETLKKRNAEEMEASKKVQAEAQEYLKEFYEKRSSHIERKKKENRDVEEAAKLKPTGDTAWERVISLIDFKFDAGRQKEVDRDRFKNLLFTAKERNVPVATLHTAVKPE